MSRNGNIYMHIYWWNALQDLHLQWATWAWFWASYEAEGMRCSLKRHVFLRKYVSSGYFYICSPENELAFVLEDCSCVLKICILAKCSSNLWIAFVMRNADDICWSAFLFRNMDIVWSAFWLRNGGCYRLIYVLASKCRSQICILFYKYLFVIDLYILYELYSFPGFSLQSEFE